MNLPKGSPFVLSQQISHRKNQIVSRQLAHQDQVHLSLFSFDQGESVSEQSNSEDIVIFVLEGEMAVQQGEVYLAKAGQVLAIPKDTLHRVYGQEISKIIQFSTNKGEKAMEQFIQKVNQREVLKMGDVLEYESDGISSLAMVQRESLTLTLMAFDAGQKIASHSSTGDALVQVLEGTASIDIDGSPYTIPAGSSIVMPANTPHAVEAKERFKMMLTVVKPL